MVFNCKVFMAKSSAAQPELSAMPPSPLTPTSPQPHEFLSPAFRDYNDSHSHQRGDVEAGFSCIHTNSQKCDHCHRAHKEGLAHRRSLRTLYVMVTLFFCFILSANAILLLLLPRWNSAPHYSCVECDSLRLSSDPMDDFSQGFERKLQDDMWICCAKNASQEQKILEVYVDKQLRTNWAADSHQALPHVAPPADRPLNLPNDTTAPPVENLYAAHLFLETVDHHEGGRDLAPVRGWANPHGGGDLNFVRSGIQYDSQQGRLTIKKTGIYQVYSHLVFKGLGADFQLFSQVIAREQTGTGQHSQAGLQPLLEDAEWVSCEPMQTLPCYTSHLASQLALKKGDQIYVYAKPVNQLKADRRSSFFGLYYLSA